MRAWLVRVIAAMASVLVAISCAIVDGGLFADGIVLDSRGQPVAGAKLKTRNSTVITDAAGCFHFVEMTNQEKHQMPFAVEAASFKPFTGTIDSPGRVRVRVTLADLASQSSTAVDAKPTLGSLKACEPADRYAGSGGSSSVPTPAPKPPEPYAWIAEMRTYIDRFTGPNATDCGQHFLRPAGVDAATIEKSVACGVAAARAGRPFFTLRQDRNDDSTSAQGLVGTSEGTIYRFFYSDNRTGAADEPEHPGSITFMLCPSPAAGTARDVDAFLCTRKGSGP